jgi:hypothetical protein
MRSKTNLKKLSLIALLAIVVFAPNILADNDLASCPVRFAIASDRTGGHVDHIYDQIIAEIERMRPDFVMTVGDQIEGYTDDTTTLNAQWNEYNEIVAPLTMPLHLTPGNHDIRTAVTEQVFRKFHGDPYYSFDYRSLHFIVLNVGPYESSAEIDTTQLNWLANDLKKNKNAAYTFVFMHKPFWYETTVWGKPDTLHSLFVNYGVDAVFTGHFHEYFSGTYDGIMYTSLGSSGAGTEESPDGMLYQFGWVTVDGDGIHYVILNKNATRPWDEITAEERLVYEPIRRSGLRMGAPVPVNNDLTVTNARATVVLDNSWAHNSLNDTVKWVVPDNWKVEPEALPINIQEGDTAVCYFNVSCDSDIYPVPTCQCNFIYAVGKMITAENYLHIARQAECYRAKDIKIDGDIKEKAWGEPITKFFPPEVGEKLTEPVKFYFAHDKKNLYLAAYCQESDMDSLKADVTEHDGAIYGEDCVGYFIEPIFHSDTIYQIYFNPNGVSFDQKIWTGEDGYADADRSWNGSYKTKTVKGDNYWSIEIQVPIKQFGLKEIKPDDKMRLNFRRKQSRLGTASNWQSPIDYYADTYGYLIMK